MPIDLEFNSALGNQTYFYQKCGSCTQKSNETWNLKIRVKTKKNICDWKATDGKWWDQNLCIFKTSGFMALAQARVDFHSDPLTFDLAQIFTKKRSKSAKSNPIFHLKGRRDTSWIYKFWIAQWVNFFLEDYFVLNLAIFLWWKKRSKLDQKCKFSVSPVSIKNWVFQKILMQCFCFLDYYLWWTF